MLMIFFFAVYINNGHFCHNNREYELSIDLDASETSAEMKLITRLWVVTILLLRLMITKSVVSVSTVTDEGVKAGKNIVVS